MIAWHAFLSKSALRVSALTKLLSIKNLKNWQDRKPVPKQANSINISMAYTYIIIVNTFPVETYIV